MTTTKLTVPDISCGHCEITVKNALSPLAGVQEVSVDLPAKIVSVSYDPAQIDIDALSAALAEEDYPVSAAEVVAVG